MRQSEPLHVCAWCRSLADGDTWVPGVDARPLTAYTGRHSATISHGICPACASALDAEHTRKPSHTAR